MHALYSPGAGNVQQDKNRDCAACTARQPKKQAAATVKDDGFWSSADVLGAGLGSETVLHPGAGTGRRGGPRESSAGESLIVSPIRSPGGSGRGKPQGRLGGNCRRNLEEKHVDRKVLCRQKAKLLFPFWTWDTLFSRIARAPQPTNAAEISGWVFWMRRQEAPCSLRRTAVQEAGRMRRHTARSARGH